MTERKSTRTPPPHLKSSHTIFLTRFLSQKVSFVEGTCAPPMPSFWARGWGRKRRLLNVFFRFVKTVSGRLFAPRREAFPQLPNLVNVFWLLRWAKLFGPKRVGFEATSGDLNRVLVDSPNKFAAAGRGGDEHELGRFFLEAGVRAVFVLVITIHFGFVHVL